MTRLLTTGYETGDLAEAGVSNTTGGALSVVNSTPTPRAGSYCLKVAATGALFGFTTKSFALPASKTDLWMRFAVLIHPLATTVEWPFAQMSDSAAAQQSTLIWDATSQLLKIRNGPSNGTLIATSSTGFPPDTWHLIDWRMQITSATAGTSEVWLDGNRIINFSGDNTNTANANVQSVAVGQFNGLNISSATGTYLAFDDIAVNDTAGTINNGRAGDGRVVLLLPTGAGSSTQFTRGGTDTGANYSQVNELPPSFAQYVTSGTVGNRDLYALADLAVAVQSINCVEAIALAQNSDAGGGSIAPTLKSGVTTNEATAIGLSTSPGYVTSRWEVDPNTSTAWTVAAINALEAGATVR